MANDPTEAYRAAGVDVAAGDALVERIKGAAARTARPGVVGSLGGFAGLFALQGYQDPLLVSGTDGVGTKLLVAQKLGRHDTIGQDLVAMCVNDVVVTGAEPLFFLDYLATGALDVDTAAVVIEGIAAACVESGCALLGGETAEMPGMYGPGHYDLAGFCVGVVERDQLLDPARVAPGNVVVGLPSSGFHSNGFSLIRRLVVDVPGFEPEARVPGTAQTVADALLAPTRLYVSALRGLLGRFDIRAAAHITGGGITGNLPRVLPAGCGALLERDALPMPPLFRWLQRAGDLDDATMWATFNCGIGMAVVVPAAQAPAVAEAASGRIIGRIGSGTGVEYA